MTTFAGARAELIAAMAGVGHGATSAVGRINPPCIYVAGDGAAIDHVTIGKHASTWRLVLVAGKFDADASAGELDTLKQGAIAALRALDGWRLEPLGRDGIRTFGGAELLTAELRGVRMIDT